MKNINDTVGTVPAFIKKIVEICKFDIPSTHINKGNNKLPNSEQSYIGKVKTHKYINRQNQSTIGKL